ncbi:hypothetical protein Ciccas_001403 [Cichlidogyrus casuarinus]|uniref:Uncharacterized protein n=1 Tax=Cichlidogyrus casuarinus TaxID=1844966 RepID=A0ABD2QK38_9PLAT
MTSSISIFLVVGHVQDEQCIEPLKTSFDNALKQLEKRHATTHPDLLSTVNNFLSTCNTSTTTVQTHSSAGLNLFLQVAPSVEQFKTSLFELLQSFVKDPTCEDADVVHLVYSGQILEPSGEWLFSDSALSGAHFVRWLDGASNKSHEIFFNQLLQHRTTKPLALHVFTSHVGDTSEWQFTKGKAGASGGLVGCYDAVIHRFRLHLSLAVHGTLFVHGKPLPDSPDNKLSLVCNLFADRFLRELVQQNCQQSKTQIETTRERLDCNQSNAKLFIRDQRPQLYVFPVGDSVTHGCASLVNIDNFTLLLGAPFTTRARDPVFWSLVSALDRIDAFVLPDWSARSVLFQRYVASLKSCSRLGPMVVCPGEPISASQMGVVPEGSVHNICWAQNSAEGNLSKFQLYHKVGLGDLSLQPLAQKTGLLLLWKGHQTFLRILMPTEQVLPSGGSAQNALVRLFKALLALAPQVHLSTANPFEQAKRPSTIPAKRPTTATTAPKTTTMNAAMTRPKTAVPKPTEARKPSLPTQAAKPAPKPAVPKATPRTTVATNGSSKAPTKKVEQNKPQVSNRSKGVLTHQSQAINRSSPSNEASVCA